MKTLRVGVTGHTPPGRGPECCWPGVEEAMALNEPALVVESSVRQWWGIWARRPSSGRPEGRPLMEETPRSRLNWLATIAKKEPEGPLGEKTSRTKSGMVRQTLWLHEDEAEALRDGAYQQRRTEPSIMREALRRLLGTED